MKKLLTLLHFFLLVAVYSQTPVTIVKENTYTVTGSETLVATQSIILKPNTHIKSGSNFRAYINQDAYTPVSLSNENYIYTRVFQKATKTGVVSENKDVLESVIYYDGLGRPKQNIGIRQSPSKKDIVTHIEYDALGRQAEEFLPYMSSNNNGRINGNARIATQSYYKSNYTSDFSGITDVRQINSFSKKAFDGSPLNRVMKQSAPGKLWKLGSGREIKFDYQTNKGNEVKSYYVTTVLSKKTYIPTLQLNTSKNGGNYLAGQLYKTITKDENWTSAKGKMHTTEEFKNKQGQVILKRTYISNTQTADTYYVYDDYGNLTYVLPPKSEPTVDKPNSLELRDLCYQYKYDYRNRLVEKRIPGKGEEYIVYDKLDRPVLTQDANQRKSRKWLFTKYDVFGRIVYTGIYTHGTPVNQNQMASYFNSQNNTPAKLYEKKLTSSGVQGSYYSNNNFPNTGELLTVSYYDNYTFNRSGASTSVNSYGINSTSRLKGLPTGSRVKVLDKNEWITTVTYYDEKARPIYVYSKNDYLNTIDVVKHLLDFAGKVKETTTIHNKTNDALPIITTIDKFEYDHTGRLKKQTQKINNQPTQVIAENYYDNLGQLTRKSVGGTINQNRLQGIDYKYNIRGWLTNINNVDNIGKDLFGFKINYTSVEGISGASGKATPLFNGNIAQTIWKTKNMDKVKRGYGYKYDALNRLSAGYSVKGNTLNTSDKYSMWLNYDKNGNILLLHRNGVNNNNVYGKIDQLTYSYKGNQLVKVSDAGASSVKSEGFKDGTNVSTEYVYDGNGNMIKDFNKGITSITYNHLNLPTQVTINGKDINYIYAADGTKLGKKIWVYGDPTVTLYAGNFIYTKRPGRNTVYELQFFNHPEGYVKNDNGTFKYVYQYKDHLDNVRLSYTDANNDGSIDPNTEIIEEKNFYPFGLKHKGYNNVVNPNGNSTAQKFGYNGKELNESLGLNVVEMNFRQYDPAIGRFNVVDAMAEMGSQLDKSPYAFAWNNPIVYNDPSGLCPECEENVSDPTEGQIYNSTGGGSYIYENGSWVRNDGVLDEIVVGGSSTSASDDATGEDAMYAENGDRLNYDEIDWSKVFAEEIAENRRRRNQLQKDFLNHPISQIMFVIATGGVGASSSTTGTATTALVTRTTTATAAAAKQANFLRALIQAGNALDKAGLTRAGRALQKHGSRVGSSFPKATGNAVSMNGQAQKILTNIVKNPASTTTVRHHGRFGKILEVMAPNGQGARFSANGKKFIGFIE